MKNLPLKAVTRNPAGRPMVTPISLLTWTDLEAKAGQMRALSILAAFNTPFRRLLYNAAIDGGFTDVTREALPFIEHLLKNYVYSQDPFIELYQFPEIFFSLPFGDCDDVSLFIASALNVLRIPNEFIFQFKGNRLQHVFNRAYLNGASINIDYARPANRARIYPAEEPAPENPEAFNRRITQTVLTAAAKQPRIKGAIRSAVTVR